MKLQYDVFWCGSFFNPLCWAFCESFHILKHVFSPGKFPFQIYLIISSLWFISVFLLGSPQKSDAGSQLLIIFLLLFFWEISSSEVNSSIEYFTSSGVFLFSLFLIHTTTLFQRCKITHLSKDIDYVFLMVSSFS